MNSSKISLKYFIVFISIIVIVGAGYYFLFYKTDKAGSTVADNTFRELTGTPKLRHIFR